MTRIAFATYSRQPSITDDDRLVVRALAGHGVTVDGIAWDGPAQWETYAAVLPRSTWDFHHRVPEFRRWLDALTVAGVPTLNPSRLLQWNLTKHYLRSLESRGVGIVPTLWATGDDDPPPLAEMVARGGWHGAVVVKPAASASAHGTWVALGRDHDADERRFRASLSASAYGLMLQPFLPEVQAEGEWSLIFLGGRFSHAVIKRPAAGDFRVQAEHGGSSVAARPAVHVVDAAERALHAAAGCNQLAPAEVLYARVDGVVHEGRFLVMELEVVEPFLFIASAPEAAARMAQLIESALVGEQ